MEVKGGTGGAFYRLGRCPWRAGHAETVRAMRGRGGLGRVLPAHEEGEGSDGRGPPGGERWGRSAGLGQNEGAGPVAGFWAVRERKKRRKGRRKFGPVVDCRRRKRKREKERWARPKQERGEERKGFPFLKRFQHIHLNLNLENLNSTEPNQLNKCNSALMPNKQNDLI